MLSGLEDDASEFFSVLEGGGFGNPESCGVKLMTLNVLLDLNPSSLSTKGEKEQQLLLIRLIYCVCWSVRLATVLLNILYILITDNT